MNKRVLPLHSWNIALMGPESKSRMEALHPRDSEKSWISLSLFARVIFFRGQQRPKSCPISTQNARSLSRAATYLVSVFTVIVPRLRRPIKCLACYRVRHARLKCLAFGFPGAFWRYV
jgi:hypothetical protein